MEAIEHADTTNEHGKLLIEPMNELEIGKDVSLMRIVKVLKGCINFSSSNNC